MGVLYYMDIERKLHYLQIIPRCVTCNIQRTKYKVQPQSKIRMRNYCELKHCKIFRILLRFRQIFEGSNNISNIFNLIISKHMTLKAWELCGSVALHILCILFFNFY
jgi:hypothetical protein